MSDWEIVNEPQAPSLPPESDWEVVSDNNSQSAPQSYRMKPEDFAQGSDILRDMVYGFGKSVGNISKLLTGNGKNDMSGVEFRKAHPNTMFNAPQMDQIDKLTSKLHPNFDMPDIRSKNSNPMAVEMGGYLPFALAGGTSFAGAALGGAAHGLTQYEPGQEGYIDSKLGIPSNRFTNTIEDALLAVPLSIGKVFKGKAPVAAPSPPVTLSDNIAKELHNDITGGRSYEQSGKQLAENIRNSYADEVAKHKERYDNIFNHPTENESYVTGEPLKVKEMPMYGKDYLENYRSHEFPDKDVQLLHEQYVKYPSIEKAHKLQSELGSEIGYMKKQNTKGNLDQTGKNKLKDYVKAQNSLKDSMEETLHDINPQLAQEYKNVTESWKNNVIPFHSDKDLKSIAEGKTKNPTTSQIISIFKNPEESMNTVVSKLPEEAKDRIVHLGMGKDIYENAPKDLLGAEKSIRTKGLSSYVAPQHEQMFRNLRNNFEKETKEAKEYEANQKLIENIQKEKLKDKKDFIKNIGLIAGGSLGTVAANKLISSYLNKNMGQTQAE